MTDGGRDYPAIGFEQHPDATIVVEGPGLRVVALNGSMRDLIGDRDVTGRPLAEAMPELRGQEVLELFQRVYQTGEPLDFQDWRIRLGRADGSQDELHVDLALRAWRDDHGDIAGCIGRAVDGARRVPARRDGDAAARGPEGRFAAALDAVITIQDALLPLELPLLPQVDVEARYLLATDDTSAGGDWFDAVVRDDGSVVLVVGDVVGHGVVASSLMGQLRAVLHDHLLAEESLDRALHNLDRYAGPEADARGATVCLVALDPRTGRVEYCTAGHPPPLVISRDGEASYLEPSSGGPIATGSSYPVKTAQLGEEELVLLYSDGLVERPEVTPSRATVELARVASDAAARRSFTADVPERTPERVAQLTMELLTRVTGYSDDITLIVAQRTAAQPEFDVEEPAVPATVSRLRQELQLWLDDHGAKAADQIALQHIVGELATNVVEHAYTGSGAGTVAVTAELDPRGVVQCRVTDHGRWQQPGHGGSSRPSGLTMVRALSDDLHIEPSQDGTSAAFSYRLTRNAELLTGDVQPGRGTNPAAPFSTEVSGELVTVQGRVDLVTVGDVERATLAASHGGTTDLTIDLTDVTHLGSTGVRLLHETQRPGAHLRLIAPPGSVAQQVLELVGLPYETSLE